MLAQGATVREAVQRSAALPAEARTRRQNRPSIGSNFASHAEVEQAKQGRAVDELMALMPPSVATALLGGCLATEQMPDPQTREALVRQTVALKAGPDGATVANAVRAWHAYTEFAALHKLPNQGLPGSAAFVASFLTSEATRAAGRPQGPRSGDFSCKLHPIKQIKRSRSTIGARLEGYCLPNQRLPRLGVGHLLGGETTSEQGRGH